MNNLAKAAFNGWAALLSSDDIIKIGSISADSHGSLMKKPFCVSSELSSNMNLIPVRIMNTVVCRPARAGRHLRTPRGLLFEAQARNTSISSLFNISNSRLKHIRRNSCLLLDLHQLHRLLIFQKYDRDTCPDGVVQAPRGQPSTAQVGS